MSSDGSALCGVLVATKKELKKRPDLGRFSYIVLF